uniref:BPL/LPL catalytic domain-containing protein n=1 Tax=Timema douglasi TaxID=61478 RepID=A0A7R8ZDX7_TIMDO|nr:unnamed protein product [Timema douglasi]
MEMTNSLLPLYIMFDFTLSVSQETFSPHHLSRGGSDETETRLEEEKSVESFHSVAQDPIPQDSGSITPSDIPPSIKHTELSPSTLSVVSQSGGKLGEAGREELSSPLHELVILKHPIRTRGLKMKPPNVLVFSESSATLDNTVAVLHSTLQRHRYCIYPTSKPLLLSSPWSDHAQLLVVCGTVPDVLAPVFMSYLLSGGHMLCLCSDFLHLVLPTFRTAEVRERELVHFSYGRWKQVPMMHHIFCYQASPAKSRFPQEDDGHRLTNPPKPPATVEVMDGENKKHTLQVQVLGAEETWHTPSLLLASVGSSGGKVVFSQVHLEVDPGQYESEETKFQALQKSDKARLEILQDLLSSHLGLSVAENQGPLPAYTPGYFLGRHELKLDFLSALQPRLKADNILKLNLLSLQFCGKGVEPAKPTASLMPVFLHACPQRFSTVEYFENLHSEHIGRLLIFSEVMTSSMEGLDGAVLHHGLAVVASQQISGAGRSGNAWLSPEGCGMFSLQLHIRSDSYLGHHVPFLQHVVSLAVVLAICSQTGHEDVDLHLKWPNDIYVGDCIKVGGLVVKTIVDNTMTVCNIGVGMNLDNNVPTTCINTLLRELKLAPLSLEKFLALVFTKLEKLLVTLEKGSSGVDQVRQLYYKYWLHSNCEVTVIGPQGSKQEVTILGIDDFGFLQVLAKDGCAFSVHPDGNSFDMLRGLIAPKVK